MSYNEATGLVSIVYERGEVTCFSSGIEVAIFDTDWVLSHKRPNEILRGKLQLPDDISGGIPRDESLIVELSKDFSQYAHLVQADAIAGCSALKLNREEKLVRTDLTTLTGNMSYFIVFKNTSATADNSAMLLQSSHAQGIRTHLSQTTESVTTYVGSSVYNCAQAQEYLDTNWHILAVTWNGDSRETAILTQFQDGMTSLKYEIGKNVTRAYTSKGTLTVGKGFDGEIAEVLVWNRALTDTEVAQTGLALAEKYGLQWALETPPDLDNGQHSGDEGTTAIPETSVTEPGESAPPANEGGGCRSVAGRKHTVLPLLLIGAAVLYLLYQKRKQKGAF